MNCKILYVTNMYPNLKCKYYGIFVKEQIEEIERNFGFNYEVYYINSKERGWFQYLSSVYKLVRLLRQGNYDLIHIHYGLSGLFLLFHVPKVRVFLTLHGADILSRQGKWIQIYLTKRILRRVFKVFILNREMETVINPLKVNYEILPCGVNTKFFMPEKNGKPRQKIKQIIFPSDPNIHIKNFRLFEDIMRSLTETSGCHVTYKCVVGLTRQGVKDLLTGSDCLLMTSFSEGSPQIVKEALACGLPVVSVPVGDVPDMIDSIPFCFVSKTYSIEELCRLVTKTFGANPEEIRNRFLAKKIYDNSWVAQRLGANYLDK